MRNRLIDKYGLILLFCLLCGIEVYAVDRDLWIRVERVDSLFQVGRMSEARAMAEKLLPEVIRQEDALSEARLRLIMGTSMRSEGMEQEALEQMRKAAKLVDSSQFERLDSHAQRHFAAMLFATLAMNELEMGHPKESVQPARASIKLAQRLEDKALQAFIFPYMGHVLVEAGQVEEGMPFLLKGKDLAHELGLVQYEKVADMDVARVQAKAANGSPTDEGKELAFVQDSMHAKPSGGFSVQVRDTVVKRMVMKAPQEKSTETAWWRHRQVLWLGGLLAFVMLGMLGIYLFRQHRLKRRITQLQEDSESRYLEGKEEERNRLAKEMHDGVSNQLLAIEMKLQSDGLTPQTMQMLTESREQVRRVSHELMPPDFEHATLDEIIRNYVEELNGANGCELSYRSEPVDADWNKIPKDKALGIYRIVQEALGNSLRHSGATLIAVVLQQAENLVVTVVDNGKRTPQQATHGIGLRTMRQRAESIGGKIIVREHGGTQLFMLEVK